MSIEENDHAILVVANYFHLINHPLGGITNMTFFY